ncbi:translation factor GTPase family protein [Thomasclavelia spiroformis]|uniref:translation factor GTPase family protein n=1 Tax=Thomasclavelia spiroformis TaxID=29348 RepID=UPI000B389F35|nr:TetM/TetW/TetO/TetS family tetracycline resistance ribosomal protection protein [Thomasclavelia spiroformis]OUO71529.1 translation elongation factor G [Thomasclavelia spiroformis]
MKKIVLGILAHVDAGKTTLTESMLYLSKTIRHLGRVDHGDAFLDYNSQERDRGITIFSKQAIFNWNDCQITLIDTPGHVDFSTEMERTLQVLDYAILVISGIDGIQNHSETIWKLLKHYHVPTFIFINKMDSIYANKDKLLNDLKDQFDVNCFDFENLDENFYETIALNNEKLLDYYLEHQTLTKEMIIDEIYQRNLFPCFFGSALKIEGIDIFLNEFTNYVKEKQYPKQFQARVFKITHDKQGNKLTHLKITGGSLKVKEQVGNEKVDQIRIYSGDKYQLVNEVYAGDICAIKGFKNFEISQGLGNESTVNTPILSPYMDYRIILPENCNQHEALEKLLLLSKEDPQLHINYNNQSKEIHVELMGEIQVEILKNIISERFNLDVEFDHGNIIYKETILEPVEGVGHFEPLRHYAEVHLLLEPGKPGSGLEFAVDCKENVLATSYQRLVLSHLKEKEHIGVLTGSLITDMKITLISGRAHLKHTEGGDFREATYRALRQGLKATKSILLEPYFKFSLEIPVEYLSRAIYDIETMNGTFKLSKEQDEMAYLTGKAPVSKMQNYQSEVISYTKGKGRITLQIDGYYPCTNQEEIISKINYDSESDLENPTGSVFCSHGAGFNVKWDEVENYMHIPYQFKPKNENKEKKIEKTTYSNEDEELENIFIRTYGPIKQHQTTTPAKKIISNTTYKYMPECLLVDGYNIIHSWPELKELAKDNLDAARTRLIDIMCNYQGYKKCILILVFDAYKVKNNLGSSYKYHNIYIVYTKEAQTADMYIERTTHELASKYNITVATSDALEQLIVLGQGGKRISSRELRLEVERLDKEKLEEYRRKQAKGYNYLLEDIKNYNKE